MVRLFDLLSRRHGRRRGRRFGRFACGYAARRLSFEPLEARFVFAGFDVLVFSKTAGFRHDSIAAGIQAIQELGAQNDFAVVATEDAGAFNSSNLAQFETVVFLNTTGDVLNSAQQAAFENYIETGGGFVGVHSAADTEYAWPWYGQLVGAYFASHPAIQTATIKVADQVHPSTAGLPDRWVRSDEWYNYRLNPRGTVHVLATLDETTYNGGTMGFDHPIAWCQNVELGRSWYTGLGHTTASYGEPLFREHLLGGIRFAAGDVPADAGATVWSNFNTVVLDDGTLDPMQLDVAADGRVFFVERAGAVKVWEPATSSSRLVGQIPVVTTGEDGLLGIVLDPNFATNHWLYVFYSAVEETAQHISRFTLVNGQLAMASERVLLRVPLQRTNNIHSGGALGFGPEGNLFIALGDNTNPFESNGYAPIDERPGRSDWDAQKSSSNADDLRGKILRIKPQPDGTYAIPEGNLFPADGSQGRPEIYVMGNRNPFRFTVDSETGWLYWGEVGPDAFAGHPLRGPAGHDEWNQARAAGNFGWPYFVADNKPYIDFDFATGQSGQPFNPAAPQNDSPNNTGALNLPPAQPAWIWYPYSFSLEFPELGIGGRTAMAGPVYHFEANDASQRKLPAYYDDTLFIYEWSRNWIMEVKLDAAGNVLKINPFLPNMAFQRPMDMKIGPDGAIYLLEWGTNFGGGNTDSRLIRIDYRAESPRSIIGTPNDDTYHVRQVGSQVLVFENTPPDGEPAYTIDIAGLSGPLTIDAAGGDDVVFVNPLGQDLGVRLVYNSGAGNNRLVLESGGAAIDSTVAEGGTLDTTIAAGAHMTTTRLAQNSLVLEDNSKLFLGPNVDASKLTSLTVGGGATLDLWLSRLVIDYSGDSPLAMLREKILSGRGGPGFGASWTGTGITSSAVAMINQTAPEAHSVAVVENALLPLGPYTAFHNVPVDNTSVLMGYTPTADANLDGLVDDGDVTIVGATYAPGVAQSAWELGDFDYNGFVGDEDVTLLGALYQASVPAAQSGTEGTLRSAQVNGPTAMYQGPGAQDATPSLPASAWESPRGGTKLRLTEARNVSAPSNSPDDQTAAINFLVSAVIQEQYDSTAALRPAGYRRACVADEFWAAWPS
jgi:glucose/arabinose dehydrogenase/type 1 glutamine amidotransferase